MARHFGTLWSLVREFNLGELREELEQPVRIILAGLPSPDRQVVAECLGAGATPSVFMVDLPLNDTARRWLESADLVLVVVPEDRSLDATERAAIEVAQRAPAAALVLTGRGYGRGQGATQRPGSGLEAVIDLDLDRPPEMEIRLVDAVIRLLGTHGLALGRQVPRLRERIVERLIRETAIANAQFAALSALPGWIPILGGLAGDTADLLVLTKNQMLMVYKLAGVYGRDLHHARTLLLEITPVAGGAFFWRTVARSLVGLLPGPLAVAPKAAIAYVGTATVGEIARRYYRDGVRLSPDAIRDVQRRALARFRGGDAPSASPPAT
ncbi:MAG: hypothetical protein QOF51_742 [Chloroflexota bacterium]|nr:hypothetical protein [Chloroflexota bacterium]